MNADIEMEEKISQARNDKMKELKKIRKRKRCRNICKAITEISAWVGGGLLVTAYIKDDEYGLENFVFNTIGSTTLVMVGYKKKAFQSMIINSIWLVGGFYKYFRTDS